MSKNKRILISLCISLILLIIFNVIYSKIKTRKEIKAYIVTKNIATGENINSDNTSCVSIMLDNANPSIISNLDLNKFAKVPLNVGQILTLDLIENEGILNDGQYENISLPITSADDATSYKIKKGSKVNIYYTAKYSNVSEALESGQKLVYSSKSLEGVVTTKLYENIEVVSLTDGTGQESNMYSQIQIRVDKGDIARLVCLKQFGTFTLTLSG